MTVTIELPSEIEAGLLAQAQAEGVDVSDYVCNLVRRQVLAGGNQTSLSSPAHELPPEEWVRQFREWSQSHAHDNLPVLSDEALSRESIYEDRGL